MPIHLRKIKVDRRSSIKNRHNFVVDFINDTCAKLQHLRGVTEMDQKEVGLSPCPVDLEVVCVINVSTACAAGTNER